MPQNLSENGDKVEFMRLFSEVAGRIFSYIFVLVHDHDLARDVFQETSVALWESFDQFDHSRDFYPWARQIAHYRILQCRQRRQRDIVFLSEDVLDLLVEETGEGRSTAGEQQRVLAECCEKLSPQDRELLDRRYAPGARVETVASDLGRSLHQVYRSLRRIHHSLQDCVRRALSEGDA
jgi:RNA polymerase sigma-70 factor (ECF subfamily)